MREQHRRAGIRQHERQPLCRIAGVERQIGAARLENADEPQHHLQRALEAKPHHRLRTHTQRAQMLRQLVGASLKLRIAERLLLEHNRNRIRRLRRLRRKQLRNRPRLKRPRRRVPILQDPAPLLPRDKLKPPNRNLRRRNRSLQKPTIPPSPAGVPSAWRCSPRLTDRSNLALALETGSMLALSPESSNCTGALFCNASITWNSGWCDSDRAGLSTSTSRSNGTSWWLYADRLLARTRPIRSKKLGFPDVSVRSTSVFTKNPIRSSSALSVRPAIGLPIAMSLPAPSRLNSAASPACSTMKRLAP